MSQLRLNLLTGRWVTVVPSRAKRTSDFAPRAQQVENDPDRECPFCPDSAHSHADVPLLENVDAAGNWQLRVIPNRYPAFEGDESLAVRNLGPVHVMAEASGTHEVFVYSPEHEARLDQLSDNQIAQLMTALKARFIAHAKHSLHASNCESWSRSRRITCSPTRAATWSSVCTRRNS